MKRTNAALLTLAATLALAPAFSGCSEETEAPKQEAKDIDALKEQQKEIIQKERNIRSPNKKAAKG